MTLLVLVRRTMLVGLVAALAACGSSVSSLEVCNHQCDTNKRCGTLSDADAANCHTDCENNKGSLSDHDAEQARMCKNAESIIEDQNSCLAEACNKVKDCLDNVDTTCVVKQ